ncbi:unnamed protein product [Blumeria hordei]|uniref:Alpha N-terminal protein methyltransferase 1 n=1 Tax=Blumeria hordei TaxID=2867405 RepID=A0A383UY13_BLUHO|nr:unnamed protein product [Blumeria hordei]
MAADQINHEDSLKYWQGINADVEGMLGGFSCISKIDLRGSKRFLSKVHDRARSGKKMNRVLDCGAGIGRITQGLLLEIADTVDIVEPIIKFTKVLEGIDGVGRIFNVGLENWSPDTALRYDLIWNQWCLGHLTDVQLVSHLRRSANILTDNGLIIVKENLSSISDDVFDEVDSSITRQFRELFGQANLQIKDTEIQSGFPKELYSVRTYALVPKALQGVCT